MEGTVEARIHEALDRRREQRLFVDELSKAWHDFGGSFDAIIDRLAALRDSLDASPQRSEFHTRVGAEIRRIEATPPGLAALRQRIAEAARAIDDVQYRVQRDTVNIGVVGMTRAGKSTLLRRVTELGDSAVPTEEFDPTTAAASRIYHRPGPSSAHLYLHTWESFRDLYLAPLYEMAAAGALPRTFAQFAAARLPAGGVTADRYLRKLHTAQANLGDYRGLLGQGERDVPLDELRPYVAYPKPGTRDPHHYHAVRVAHIYTPFRNVTVADLGLVDFPGRGEAGLDIERVFLTPMQREVDTLVMVKRPDVNSSFMTDEDWQTIELADEAKYGVPLEQFLTILINRDRQHVGDRNVERAAATVREQAGSRGIHVAVADVTHEDEVFHQLMAPLLEHLARNLAEMDRAAVRMVLLAADEVRCEVERVAEELITASGRWRNAVPNAEQVFRKQVRRLFQLVSFGLATVRDRYDSPATTAEATAELESGIAAAVADSRRWVEEGLGSGSRAQWFDDSRAGSFAAAPLATRESEINRARAEVGEFFMRIDACATASVVRLWQEIVEAIRAPLTETIVPVAPTSDRPLAAFRARAEERRAPLLMEALDELDKLDIKYGSIVLRVARPIIRRIHADATVRGTAGTAARLLHDAGNLALGAAGVAGAVAGAMTGAPVVVVPAAPAPAEPARSDQWWNNPLRTAAAPGPAAQSPAPAGSLGVSEVDLAARGAEALYDEVTRLVTECIDELDAALRREARVMALALAAAADQFFDAAIRRNDVVWEYEELCDPYKKELWPDIFGGGEALAAAEIGTVGDEARLLVDGSRRLADLGASLHLQAPGRRP